MKRVAEMIAVFARSIEYDRAYEDKELTLSLIRRYCDDYQRLMDMEEDEWVTGFKKFQYTVYFVLYGWISNGWHFI